MISTAVDASAVARVVGIKTAFKNLRAGNVTFLPQRVAVIGQGNDATTYSTDKAEYTSAFAVGQAYGFGSPLHLAARQLMPVNGDGVGSIPVTFYPLDAAGGASAATGTIVPTGTQTEAGEYVIKVNEIQSTSFSIAVGETDAEILARMVTAINAIVEMPIIAALDTGNGEVDITSKWSGESANDIFIEVVGPTSGITFAVTQLSGGATNPDVQDALDKVGDVWETMFLNCLNISDTTALDTFSSFVEGRWGALTRKPCIVFSGNTATTVSAATTISDAKATQRGNSQLVAPASNELPFVVAARQLARIVVLANNNPPHDYGRQEATGLVPGDDGSQWNYSDRDLAVKAGSSTILVRDGVIQISDVVTFYHPTGDPLPAYRYVVDIVKLQNIIFNLDLIFATAEWDGAPLVPDDQPTVNPAAKKPKTAKAAVAALIDNLGANAIISDPEAVKESIQVEIDQANPKRLNIAFTARLSGNTNIISIDLNFGFYFGGI